MIREKIFRLHRHKSSSSAGTDSSGQKFDFTFSNIQALQVPKGWDKVSLSLISSESGKIVRKSGKVPVRNGTCKWTETLSESIWISDIDSSKEVEQQCLLKFLVSMGSSRSGILGEATLNLAAFLSSESPRLISSPLKKCNYGTILKVEVRCLTPKTNLRDVKLNDMHANEDAHEHHEDMESGSEVSDSIITKSSIESCSSNNFSNSCRPMELGSRETSFSASVSRCSFDSMDDSVGRQSFTSPNDRVIGRQDSIESTDSASYCSYSPHHSIRSVHSLQGKNQGEQLRKLPHANAPSLQQNGYSSKTFKEADDAVIQELEAEARMWEQNARKLAVDLESLRNELSDQNTELATSRSECHKLTQEIEHLKLVFKESIANQNAAQNIDLQETAKSDMQKELENEMRFQKEENGNLSLQLKKTQESNIELISVLQEMEVIIEKQKLEIKGLSENKLFFSEVNVNAQVSVNELNRLHDCDSDTSVSEISVADINEKVPPENNCCLEPELLNVHDLQTTLQGEILVLESTLEDKIIEAEIEQDLRNRILKECVLECNRMLAAKEEKVVNLKAALSKALSDENLEESEHMGHVDLSIDIGQLKEKVQELETDCDELTQENLELLFELKELRKNEILHEGVADLEDETENPELHSQSFKFNDCIEEKIYETEKDAQSVEENKAYKSRIMEPKANSLEKEEENKALSYQKSGLKLQDNMESIERDGVMRLMDPENKQIELVKHFSDMQEENIYLLQRVSGLEAQLRYLTDASESRRMELQQSEYQVTVLENQIRRLEEEMESQKFDMKQKLEEMEKRWLEAQEECTSLRKLNIRLQGTTESLIEECNLLQKFNGDIREQKLKLQKQCMVLEAEARKLRDSCCNCAENIGTLEVKYSLLKEEINTRGRKSMDLKSDDSDVVLAGNQEKLVKLFEKIMNDESRRESIIDGLESKIKFSELERLRLEEDNSILLQQLHNVPELQNEVLDLRVSLKEMESQTQLLETLFKSVSRDYEELKRRKVSMVQKTFSLQKAVLEAEDCRRRKNALEEKVLRLEGDLIAKDALCLQDVEMKNELNRMKITNSEFMMKVKHLEDVREYLLSRVQTLEELEQTRHAEENHRKSSPAQNHLLDTNTTQQSKLSKVFNEQDCHSRRSLVPAVDNESRVQLLENELAKALKDNDMYKAQLERFPQLAAELQEIRERYLQISLKYAEVEAQREQLVMKLKALNS